MTQAAASHWNLQAKALALLWLLHREGQQPSWRQAPQGLAKDWLQSGHLGMVPWRRGAGEQIKTWKLDNIFAGN